MGPSSSRVEEDMWIAPGMPVDSMRAETLMESPNRPKRCLVRPTIPDTTGLRGGGEGQHGLLVRQARRGSRVHSSGA
jgi:hypothetical protein